MTDDIKDNRQVFRCDRLKISVQMSENVRIQEKTQERRLRKQEKERESNCKIEARKRQTDTWRRRTAESESRPRALPVY